MSVYVIVGNTLMEVLQIYETSLACTICLEDIANGMSYHINFKPSNNGL